MEIKTKQTIVIIIAFLIISLLFIFSGKLGFNFITGGAIANANSINANLVLFRIQPPYPAAAYLWNDTLGTKVVYNNYTTPGQNPHTCTGNNLIGYINTSFIAVGGHFFYPATTTENTALLAPVCYDNFECLACSGLTTGCDPYYGQGYNCYFSIGNDDGGRVGPCTGTGQQLYNVVCREQTQVSACNRIVPANTVGTDDIIFRTNFVPSQSTSGASPNTWNSGYSIAVANDQPVGANPHVCNSNNANRIGYVNSNLFFQNIPSNILAISVVSPVCYSNFICQSCLHATGGCEQYYNEGYLPYFSISSTTAGSKVQDCNILDYNYVCKESCFTTGMECSSNIQDPEGGLHPFTECIEDNTNACCSSNNQCVFGGTCYNQGGTATINNTDMTCDQQHWCPVGFYYQPFGDKCVPQQEACYDTTDSEYCNYVYPGIVPSDLYWTDLTGSTPCIAPLSTSTATAFSKSCCDITISLIDYFFYQDIPYTLNVDPTYLQNINICGDNYDVGDSDGFCPSDFADCTPGYINDGDCCNHCGWVCDNANNLCGDNPGETWINEQDSNGNTIISPVVETCNGNCQENVIDNNNEGACTITPNTCADDYIVYQDYPGTGVCTAGTSCFDVDSQNADMEICDEGNWHEPDENSVYCEAAGILGQTQWITTDQGEYDDYDDNKPNGYCLGDDGFQVQGFVYDEDGDPLENANVQFKETAVVNIILQDDFTDSNGYYSVNILSGEYSIITEKAGYIPQTQAVIIAAAANYDFTLQPSTQCLQDCTQNDDVCHVECNNVNNCQFPTTTNLAGESVSDICDNMHKGWVKPFDTNTEVVCCDNEPRSTTTNPLVNPSDNEGVADAYTMSRLIQIKGKIVNLLITVWEE